MHQLLWINDDHTGDVLAVCILLVPRLRVGLVDLEVFKMLLFHGGECSVFDQHVIHEFVPIYLKEVTDEVSNGDEFKGICHYLINVLTDRATGISIDSHKQLVKLLIV